MKKSLLALAVLGAFAGAAQAQSAVTIYGSFDGGLRYVDNQNAAGDSRLTMGSIGNYNNNRIGFKGQEDLGGGLNAHFVLETGWNTGTGALDNTGNKLFQRTAAVGLGGAWGSIDLGRQYSVAFKTIGSYDPFNYKYTGIIPLAAAAPGGPASGNSLGAPGAVTADAAAVGGSAYFAQGGTRFDNDLQYTGSFGPVTARAEYVFGEQTGSTSQGRHMAIGGTYAAGPVTVGGTYTRGNRSRIVGGALGATGVTTTSDFGDYDNWTVGAAFKAGAVRVSGGYMMDKMDAAIAGADDFKQRNAWVGASYAVTPAFEFTGAFYQTRREQSGRAGVFGGAAGATDGKRNLFIVGATYALSKRTNFYAEVDTSKLKGDYRMVSGTTVEDRVTGLSVGINHLF